jgi:hypothetical protein
MMRRGAIGLNGNYNFLRGGEWSWGILGFYYYKAHPPGG